MCKFNLSIWYSQESQPSSPVATKVQTFESDDMTLSSLSPEDTMEEPAPSENANEVKQDQDPPVPSTDDGQVGKEKDKAEKMPNLGKIVFLQNLWMHPK